MTPEEVVEDFLTAPDYIEGRYPAEAEWIGDELVVADVDDKEAPRLTRYTREEVLVWYAQAEALVREAGWDLKDALGDYRPR